MFMKDAAFLEQLQQELPRRNLTPKAMQRFEDTYRMLGVQKEAPACKRRHKGLWVTATAACLCCGMLFGVNAAFPAFAESLPGVGQFFEALNGNFTSARGNKTTHGANLDTYDPQEVDVSAVAQDGSAQLEISQAYSDGKMLSFTLDVTLPVEQSDNFAYICTRDYAAVTVNGEELPPVTVTALSPTGDGHFSGMISCALNTPLEDGETAQVEFSLPDLSGYPRTNDYEAKGDLVDLPGTRFQTSFSVTVDTSNNVSGAVEGEAVDGAQVLSIDSTPTQTLITMELPEYYVSPKLYTMDGLEVKFNLAESIDKGEFDPTSDLRSSTSTLYFDGVPAGNDQIVLRLYPDDLEESVRAEFTIDLTTQTATPSTTYDDGGLLDLDGPFHYYSISWAGEDEPFTTQNTQMELGSLTFTRSENWFRIYVATPDEYREVEASIYTADGTLLGTTISTKDVPDGMGNGFFDEDVYFWSARENPVRSYDLYIPSETYLPAWNEAFTVVVTDTATGEELIHQTVQLTERYIL